MKEKIKKTGMILVWCLLIGGVGALLFFIDRHKQNQRCTFVRLTIENTQDNHFIDSAAVMENIQSVPLTEMKMADIDAGKIESLLKNNPHIRNAEVFKELDGTVHVRVWQKRPLMRVVTESGDGYYIDEDNMKMPLSSNYTARVVVCSGHIDEQYTKCDTASTSTLKTCTSIAHFVHNSVFWCSMTEQIFVSADNTIMLVPKLGNAKIIFGNAEDDINDSSALEDKFNRLYTFYRQAMPKTGWDKYSSIDVSFKNQVVARR
jgi:cell division protein FtsQ